MFHSTYSGYHTVLQNGAFRTGIAVAFTRWNLKGLLFLPSSRNKTSTNFVSHFFLTIHLLTFFYNIGDLEAIQV